MLRYVGNHHEHQTPRVGVELDEPFGKNDGTVSGHKVNIASSPLLCSSAMCGSRSRFHAFNVLADGVSPPPTHATEA